MGTFGVKLLFLKSSNGSAILQGASQTPSLMFPGIITDPISANLTITIAFNSPGSKASTLQLTGRTSSKITLVDMSWLVFNPLSIDGAVDLSPSVTCKSLALTGGVNVNGIGTVNGAFTYSGPGSTTFALDLNSQVSNPFNGNFSVHLSYDKSGSTHVLGGTFVTSLQLPGAIKDREAHNWILDSLNL